MARKAIKHGNSLDMYMYVSGIEQKNIITIIKVQYKQNA